MPRKIDSDNDGRAILPAGSLMLTRTVTDADGLTRFEDEAVTFALDGGRRTELLPALTIAFRFVGASFHYDYHPAPRRRYVINLSGRLGVRASGSGETRIFGPGDALFVSDTNGKGHQSFSVDGDPLRTLFLSVDEELLNPIEAPLEEDAGGFGYTAMRPDPEGGSRFEPREIRFEEAGPAGAMSALIPIEGICFVRPYPAAATSLAGASGRLFVAVLRGRAALGFFGAEPRAFDAGEVVLVEPSGDAAPAARSLDDGEALLLIAPLPALGSPEGGLDPYDRIG